METLFQKIQSGALWDFHGGIHPPTRKSQTSQKPIAVMPVPERLYIPLRQHTGVAGQLLVQEGQRVLKGQALTASDNAMTVPVHAATSGTVIAITEHTSAHPSSLPEPAIILEPDGLDEWRPREPMSLTTADNHAILERIQDSGIAGLGGAGFPTHLKIGKYQEIKYLIINAAECEPYITADDLLMQEEATTIVKGIDILCKLLNPQIVLIGLENDKPVASAAMKAACSQRQNYHIREVPVKYPSGGQKQLIKLLTGQEVPSGRRSTDIGIVMLNIGTVFAIAQAVLDDHPLISRVVTVTGDTLSQPQNVLALIGTPVSTLLSYCGFQPERRQRVIMGGPMMGFTLPDLSVPVVKITNCILAPTHKELPAAREETDCIRCSACADACPATLLPQQLLWYSKAQDTDKLKEYNLFDCIECGACAYVCPSEIPLVQYYRVAKADIREQQRDALKAEQTKARFDARNQRLEQEKQERLRRNQELAAARQKAQQDTGASNAVADALARIKARQQQTEPAGDQNREHIIAEREKQKQQARAYQQRKTVTGQQTAEAGTPATQSETAVPAENAQQAAIAAAIARAKAKKAQTKSAPTEDIAAETPAAAVTTANETTTDDPRKAAIAAAIARAKAKQAQQSTEAKEAPPAATVTTTNEAATDDPRKAAIAAAVARAKARKQTNSESS
ncbi:electron transport complex subunit RsxC [Chromatiaceae bacterium AAb-1]|nr:electron transport complex subunit RsxC [Chromatiaceae bacterium AAb-1]